MKGYLNFVLIARLSKWLHPQKESIREDRDKKFDAANNILVITHLV
jgi:hypothetical protein